MACPYSHEAQQQHRRSTVTVAVVVVVVSSLHYIDWLIDLHPVYRLLTDWLYGLPITNGGGSVVGE